MNKILIKCDGEEIILETNIKVSEIARVIEYNVEDQLIVLNSFILADETFKEEIAINPRAVTLVKDITKDNDKLPFDSESRVILTLDGKESVKPLKDSKTLNYLAKSLGECVEYDKGTLQDSNNSDAFLSRLIYEEPADSSGQYFNCCVVKRIENNRGVLFNGREIEIDKLRIKRIEGSNIFLCEV